MRSGAAETRSALRTRHAMVSSLDDDDDDGTKNSVKDCGAVVRSLYMRDLIRDSLAASVSKCTCRL